MTTTNENHQRDAGWSATAWVCAAMVGPWWLLWTLILVLSGVMPMLALACGLIGAMPVVALLDAVCPRFQLRLCERIVRLTAPTSVVARIEAFEASRALFH